MEGKTSPSIDGSNIGFAQWEHKSRSSLLGVNFDFNSDDAIFEIGIVAIVCVLIFFCFCCGCGALHGCTPAPKCLRDRKRRRKQERKMKLRRKRRMKEEEELTEQERRRRKQERRQRNFEKRLRTNHWKTRGYTNSQRRRMIGEREKREQEKEAKEEREDTGIQSGGMEISVSPDFSLSLPRGSVGSVSSGSTWMVREGSDIFSPASKLSYQDRVEKSEKKRDTVVVIEKE